MKALNTQLRRQEYLTKKQSRAAESATRALEKAESAAKESILRMVEVEKQIMKQKKQTRSELLKTYAEDVVSLKQTQRDLEVSTEAWSTR